MPNPRPPQRFYFKTYLRLLTLFNPLMMLGLAIFLGVVASSLFRSLPLIRTSFLTYLLPIGFVFLVGMGLFVSGCAIFIFVSNTLPVLFSYLDITEQGLEYRFWPTYHIQCSWADVETITQRREMMVTADVILLRSAKELGKPISMQLRKKLGLDTQYFIPLNVLAGWPQGKLRQALEHYAPQLFENKI